MHLYTHTSTHVPPNICLTQHTQDMSDGWAGRPVAPAHQSSLVAHWAFNEGSGYTVHDRSGNGHDLWALYAPTWQVL